MCRNTTTLKISFTLTVYKEFIDFNGILHKFRPMKSHYQADILSVCVNSWAASSVCLDPSFTIIPVVTTGGSYNV
jgi:hypothetical protein